MDTVQLYMKKDQKNNDGFDSIFQEPSSIRKET